MKPIIISLMILVAVSCTPSDKSKGEYADFDRVPLQSKVENVQPMTGIVLWTTNGRCITAKDKIQLEFAYMLYNEVCKEKDVYDWTPMDNLLEKVASRGHQLVVRFRYTYVGQQCSVPDYIKAWPGYEETVGKSEGRDTYFPDWRCEELQRFHLDFHKRFAERYDNDPRLAFVQTGFGLWAEYHIYDGPRIMGKTFPSKEFQETFFKEMDKYFDKTTWSISIDAADESYTPFKAKPELLEIPFGNFDDSFMHKTHNQYNRDCWLFFGEERYKTGPHGGEFSYYTDFDQKHCLDTAGMYGRVFEDEVAKYNMTYIIGNDQPGYQTMDRIKEASMSMGYKFEIKDFRVKGNEAVVLISNIGVAPIYRDAYVAVGGVKGEYSLKNLMPGQEQWIHIQGDGVSAQAVPAIECAHLVPGQKIEYDADIK
ncbi:MAG: DUF4832 domain-containing protein [Bacteroidales bacterium]|nr:DUF4832 domain-containing protein [Bacteroidales bacterium]